MPMTLHRWRFLVEDWNGRTTYVDADGAECDDDEEWGGDDDAARREAHRRADAWERSTGADVALVTRESRGKVEQNGII